MDGISIFAFAIWKIAPNMQPFSTTPWYACTLHINLCLDFNWLYPSFPFDSVLTALYLIVFYVSLPGTSE